MQSDVISIFGGWLKMRIQGINGKPTSTEPWNTWDEGLFKKEKGEGEKPKYILTKPVGEGDFEQRNGEFLNYFPGGHFLPLSAYPQLCAGDGKNALE